MESLLVSHSISESFRHHRQKENSFTTSENESFSSVDSLNSVPSSVASSVQAQLQPQLQAQIQAQIAALKQATSPLFM